MPPIRNFAETGSLSLFKVRLDTEVSCLIQRWKNLDLQQINKPRRNVLADIFYPLADIFDPLTDNFDPLTDNFEYLADKYVREKIPTWLNDLLYAKVFPPLV